MQITASTQFQGCQFVFTSTLAGTEHSNNVQLGEVRFFDSNGDLLTGMISSTTNPGGTSGPYNQPVQTTDGYNSGCLSDSFGLPSTLQLTFWTPTTFAAYELITGDTSCGTSHDPTAWQLLCKPEGSDQLGVVDQRSSVLAPTERNTAYSVDAAHPFVLSSV